MDKMLNQLEYYQERLKFLESRNQELENHITSQNEIMTKASIKYEKEIDSLVNQIEHLENTNFQNQKYQNTLKSKIEKLESEIDEKNSDLSDILMSYQKKEKEIKNMELQLDHNKEIENKLEDFQKMNKELLMKKSNILKKKETLELEIEKMKKEKEEIYENLKNLEKNNIEILFKKSEFIKKYNKLANSNQSQKGMKYKQITNECSLAPSPKKQKKFQNSEELYPLKISESIFHEKNVKHDFNLSNLGNDENLPNQLNQFKIQSYVFSEKEDYSENKKESFSPQKISSINIDEDFKKSHKGKKTEIDFEIKKTIIEDFRLKSPKEKKEDLFLSNFDKYFTDKNLLSYSGKKEKMNTETKLHYKDNYHLKFPHLYNNKKQVKENQEVKIKDRGCVSYLCRIF